MINKELLDFIKEQTQKGAAKEVVSKELLGAGWTVADIEEAFSAINTTASVPKTEIPVQYATPNINPAPKIDLSTPQSINQFGLEQKTVPEIKKEPQPQTSFQPIMQPEIKHGTIEPEIKKPEPIQPVQPVQSVQPIQTKIEPRIIEPVSKPQPITQSQTPVSNFGSFTPYSNQMSSQATIIKEKSGSVLKTFLIVLIIFLLAGSALGYFFKDKIINYFAVKDTAQPETPLAPENQVPAVTENPVVEENSVAEVAPPVIPAVEETPNVVSTPVEYKNNLLGISFKYPSKYRTVIATIKNGETGMELRGAFRGISNVEFFGGLSKDFTEGRDGGTFDFKGYNDFTSFQTATGYKVVSGSDKVKEFTTKTGVKGIMVKDYSSSVEGLGGYVLEGETAFFFNLPKFDGGIEFKFNRTEIPEYMDIINSLKITK